MDSPQVGSTSAEDRSVKTAEALRALRKKLGPRVASERRTASDVQSDIIERIFQIAEEMATEQSTEAQATAKLSSEKLSQLKTTLVEREDLVFQLQAQLDELTQDRNRLQDELRQEKALAAELRTSECGECTDLLAKLQQAEERAADSEILAEQFQADADEASRKVAELQSWQETAASQEEQAARMLDELALAELASEERSNEVASLAAERDSLAEELASVRSKLDQQIFDSATSEAHLQAALDRANATTASLQEDVTGLEELSQAGATKEHELLQEAQQELVSLRQEHDATTKELSKLQATAVELQDEKDSECERLTGEIAEVKLQAELSKTEYDKLAVEHEELSSKLESLNEELAAHHTESSGDAAERAEELQGVKQQLAKLVDEKNRLESSQEELTNQLKAAIDLGEHSAAQLQEAQEQLSSLPDFNEQTEELEQSQRKFELAQADAQKLKRELAALQEELARRPEANQQESPELVSLRVERDALAAKVAELEEMPAHVVDEDAQQQTKDLQRRFEMAVDDLRQVKQEKAELEDKLASASPSTAPAVDSGAMDWQSQKARLLASLESDEGEENFSPEQIQEKMSIQGTIEITDQIVAKKDREIAELQEQLATTFEAEPQDDRADVYDKDEMIQAERARLEALQAEWREKVRGAELEMATQRATLARKETELKELLAAAQEAAADVAASNDGKPRRRWLSALGLGDEESKEQ